MADWVWIDERDAVALHERSLVFHGGAEGVRDLGLLQSALARPRNLAAYDEAADAARLAAALTAGVIQNHPFVDGNKRTGFLVGLLFLEMNGWRFAGDESGAAEMVIALAASTVEEAQYEAYLRDNSQAPIA